MMIHLGFWLCVQLLNIKVVWSRCLSPQSNIQLLYVFHIIMLICQILATRICFNSYLNHRIKCKQFITCKFAYNRLILWKCAHVFIKSQVFSYCTPFFLYFQWNKSPCHNQEHCWNCLLCGLSTANVFMVLTLVGLG